MLYIYILMFNIYIYTHTVSSLIAIPLERSNLSWQITHCTLHDPVPGGSKLQLLQSRHSIFLWDKFKRTCRVSKLMLWQKRHIQTDHFRGHWIETNLDCERTNPFSSKAKGDGSVSLFSQPVHAEQQEI